MMLYTKNESSESCSFRQEDFLKLHFENLFFDLVTYLCNHLGRFEQLWLEEHLEIIPVKICQNPISGFRGEVVLMKRFTHARTNGRRTVTIAHSDNKK